MKYKEKLESLISKLIATPSTSGNEREIAEIIKDKLNEIGFDKVEIDKYGSVIAVAKGKSDINILFEGHLDHVPPGNINAWKYPPYNAKIVNDEVYGRGSVDMKGPITSLITAMEEALKRELEINIQLAFVVHEETVEGEAIKRIIEEGILDKPEAAILIEPTNLNVAIGHRGRSLIKVKLMGKTAHASMPDLGVNAIEAASEFIIRLREKLNKNLPIHPVLGKATITPIKIRCQPEGLPQIPDEAEVILDRRMIIGEDEDSVLKPLMKLLNELISSKEALNGFVEIVEEEVKCWTGASMKVKDFFPAWLMSIEKLEDMGVKEIIKTMGGRYMVWDFSTDGVYTANSKIKTFGFGPGDWKMAHQPNEKISLKEMDKAVEGYKKILEVLEKKLAV
jgi:putative selenium metabolism hydrolase